MGVQDPTATRCACGLLAVTVSQEGFPQCPWRLPGLDAVTHLCLAATSTMTSPMVADGTRPAAIAWLRPRQKDVLPFPHRSVVSAGGRGSCRPRPPCRSAVVRERGARRPCPAAVVSSVEGDERVLRALLRHSAVAGGRGPRCPRPCRCKASARGRGARRPRPHRRSASAVTGERGAGALTTLTAAHDGPTRDLRATRLRLRGATAVTADCARRNVYGEARRPASRLT